MAVQIMVEILREIGREIIGHPDELRKLWIQGRSRSRLHLDRIHPDSRPIRQINSIRQQDFSFRNFTDTSHDQITYPKHTIRGSFLTRGPICHSQMKFSELVRCPNGCWIAELPKEAKDFES
jgi:hypothetical protein